MGLASLECCDFPPADWRLSATPVLGLDSRSTCGVCGRSYKSIKYLRRHQQMHEGSTRCPACLQVYSSISNLQQHMRNVHNLPLPEGLTPRSRNRLARKLMLQAYKDRAGRAGASADTVDRSDGGDGAWPDGSQEQWLGHVADQ